MKKTTVLLFSLSIGLPALWATQLNHPCLLHTQEDFQYVRDHLQEEPYASALTKLKESQYCKTSYSPAPVEYLARLDANNWSELNWRWENAGIADLWYPGIHNNYINLMHDAAAAYQLSLLYQIEGNRAAANTAKKILVEWSTVNKGLLRNVKGEIVDPNEKLIMFQPYQMAVAAEILRNYGNWGQTDEFRKVTEWLDSSFYGEAHNHLQLQNETGGGHYWMNWDLASMSTILALGILRDNEDYINEALNYYKGSGGGPGNILKGVPYLHQDPDSEEMLGQGNELGRDQGHNTLCAALLATFCQMGLAIGEDLFAYDDFRALKFAEYVAKYNLAKEELYPDPMLNFPAMGVGSADDDFVYSHATFPFTTYQYGDAGTMEEPSKAARGQARPGWDYWVGYANTHGLSAIYSTAMAERIRPDGGGGQYSSNSGGFDQIGFSTLMGWRPYVAAEDTDEKKFECVADTWLRQDSPNIINGSGPKIELRMTDLTDDDNNVIGHNFQIGLMTFRYGVPEGKKLKKAYLHLVTERVKGNDVALYPYSNSFDELTACWNTEGRHVEFNEQPVAVFTAAGQKNKAIYDSGISYGNSNLAAWTNEIDITDYLLTLPDAQSSVGFMLKEEGDQVCFFSKDNTGQEIAFKDTEFQTDLPSSALKPYIYAYFEDLIPEGDDSTLGIKEIGYKEAKTEYYTLQGIRVRNPRPGEIYICREGEKVEKIVY